MHQEWLEAKPSDRMDIIYTGAQRNLNVNGFNSVHGTDLSVTLSLYLEIRHNIIQNKHLSDSNWVHLGLQKMA